MLDGRRPATYYARILQPAFANRSPVEQPVMSVDTATPIKRALLSVSDKSGLAEFGRFLSERGVEILSTGGSAKALAAAGVPVVEVADHTGFPEIMDGRVQTLHPKLHGGTLARSDLPDNVAVMQQGSEKSREGKERVRTGRSGWGTKLYQQN